MYNTLETFKIPVTWSVYGTVEIEANTIEDAISKFKKTKSSIKTPEDAYCINGTLEMLYKEDKLIKLTNETTPYHKFTFGNARLYSMFH